MNLFNKKTLVALSAATGCLVSLNAYSAGLEKNVNWSGKYNGVAGAATSSVSDSEGLIFNPAGLAGVEGNGDVHVNFSPTFSQFEGPVSSTQVAKSVTGFSPLGGLTSAYRLDDSTVLGGGVFVSGGTQARYDNVLTTNGSQGVAQSSIKLIEGTLGVATKVTDEVSVGLSWRISHGSANLSSVVKPTNQQVSFEGFNGWDFAGFRLGAQYRKQNLGLGLSVRTPLSLKLEGDTKLAVLPNPSTSQDSGTTMKATFPLVIALGADWSFNSKLKFITDLSYTNYAANKNLDISGGAFIAGLKAAGALPIPLNWHDLYILRLGSELSLDSNTVLRAGYALISAVTNKDSARATFSSPGLGHTLTLGAGSRFGNLDANAALDYSFASGTGTGNSLVKGLFPGDYKSHSYTAHLGVAYNY